MSSLAYNLVYFNIYLETVNNITSENLSMKEFPSDHRDLGIHL